ncbi:hypothetical protein Pmar_PMAR029111 [Perkinsus marinus ATCC 50983]|uniref:Uncharacterized protein n=1 Tax=Perkinsus marinus (strain ATCC 50983 / TXsc) TaxID=423536 RepID=C5M0N0_PERM5|nr:hypothetical protein Pmar_PMAR029111 [Perkinsus marinus ATCC 50983]EEQ97388.1 hypothetical protein Pmar_PMAR029111 [Perkinsus marinus ATCC 50983]|eukprot:XP_002764671.1 hypothetical protein Pmar_PMAR029111 [Perkinsus marinus ATCC 50983]
MAPPRSRKGHGDRADDDGSKPTRKEDLANLFGDDDADRYGVGDDKRALFESFKSESSARGEQVPRHRRQHHEEEGGGRGGGVYYANNTPSGSKSKSQERAVAAAQKAAAKRSRDSEGFTWKKVSIGLLFLSLFSAGAFSTILTIYDFLAAGFKNIDIEDAPALRKVLLSGDPALVYCFDKSMKVNKVPQVLKDADRDLRGIASTYTMDCHQPLPDSGKSIYQKYKFSNNLMPAFVVANGDRPVQLNSNSMANSQTVVEFVKVRTKPIVRFAKNAKQLDGMCLSRQKCLLIGYRTKFPDQVRKVVREAMMSHRGLRVVALDTSKYRLKIDPAIVPSNEDSGESESKGKRTGKKSMRKTLSFMCLNTPDRKVDLDGPTKGMVEVLSLVDKGKQLERDYDAVSFIKECDSGTSSSMKEMLDLPSISLRPPKQPKARQQEQQQSSSGSAAAKKGHQGSREAEKDELGKQSGGGGGRDALEEDEPPVITDVDDEDAEWDALLNMEEDDDEDEELNLY